MQAMKEIEELEIADFLSGYPPFDALPPTALSDFIAAISVRYARRGTEILSAGSHNDTLFVVRSGAVELFVGGTDLAHRFSAGNCFAYPSLLRGGKTRHSVKALEDTLLYCVPAALFHDFFAKYEAFRLYFSTEEAERLRVAISARSSEDISVGALQSAGTPLANIIGTRPLVTAAPSLSCGQAAAMMAEEDVSTLLIKDGAALLGILTDKDLRRRLLACNLPYDTPVAAVMTPNPITVPDSAAGFDALLLMMRHNFSHLPVTGADGALRGIVSARDLLKRMSLHALHLAQDVAKAATPEEVVAAVQPLGQSMAALVEADLTAHVISQFVSSVAEAAHRRLAELGEEALGPPPIDYDFVVFGSLARRDQSGVSDQDNGFILDDSYDPAVHGDYFKALARYVSDHLNAAGYVYCNGNIMATNDSWRQTLSDWMDTFDGWISSPEPKAVMHTSIFFDMRAVKGSGALIAQLRDRVSAAAKGNTVFLAHLAGNALSSKPPLGFFRQLVVEKDETGDETLNLKRRGIMPITDIARLQALAHGITEVGTRARLSALLAAGLLNDEDLRDLMDAQEFIAMTRLRHQAEQAKTGVPIDNLVHIERLSRFERDHLKDAFGIIRRAQSAISMSYMGAML
ncbi:MAG: putative nucleotidyltransferase substrate binding domain-containing protein [Pseudomonadota bacterium]